MELNQIATFGDARRLILDTIQELRSGTMDVGRGMAIAANMKVLNDNVQVEINATRVTLQAQQAGHDFGRIVGMGQKKIGNDTEPSA
jgi:hypothetical protein